MQEGRKPVTSKKAGGISIAPGEEKALLASLSGAEGLLRHRKDDETVVVFNDEGKGVFVKRQAGLSVDLNKSIREYPDLFRGAILTHNHPHSSSFSRDDIETACLAQLREIRITSSLYRYSLRASEGNLQEDWFAEVFFPAYRSAIMEVKPELDGQDLDAWEYEREMTHRVLQKLVDSIGLQYTRIETSRKD